MARQAVARAEGQPEAEDKPDVLSEVIGEWLLSQPIDFADPQRRGILSKEGAWYRVLDLWGSSRARGQEDSGLVHDANRFRAKFSAPLKQRVEKMALEGGLIYP